MLIRDLGYPSGRVGHSIEHVDDCRQVLAGNSRRLRLGAAKPDVLSDGVPPPAAGELGVVRHQGVEPEAGTLASAVAERAGRLGRPVFAVPGPVITPGRDTSRRRHHSEAIGAVRLFGEPAPIKRDEATPYEYAHQLVRDGAARLVRNAEDVLADLTAAGGAQ